MSTLSKKVVVTLDPVTCYLCGVTFGIDSAVRQQRQDDHGTFYCPNGHGQAFIDKSEAEQLRDQLSRQKQETVWANNRAQSWRDQAETAEARRRAEKGAKTKLQKRIANGVCPCCHRSFPNLQQHIAGEHPDFPAEG